MVVSVVVGLQYISTSILSGCRISSRSRKLMLLCSCEGVNCRLGCVLLMCWCIVSGLAYFALYIISISSMYLV